MAGYLSQREVITRSLRVQHANETTRSNFAELLRLAGIDPSTEIRHENWAGASFQALDLAGFDFTGACLHGCDFSSARLSDGTSYARFEQAELGLVTPSDDPHKPAHISAIANLCDAVDWEQYCKTWQSPQKLPDDAHLPTGAIFQDAPFAPEMVVVTPGRFMMGSPEGEERWQAYDGSEGPRHEVAIDYRLAVGRFPVTFAEWDLATELGGPDHRPNDQGWGRGQRPVINVSWDDAIAYCSWLQKMTGQQYRLLSEAEWEYVCRAGTETPFWWGDQISTEQANYNGNHTYGSGSKGEYREKTVPVDHFKPNPWGLYQVHGNVWEWCADPWHENYNGAPEDGSVWQGGDTSLRVVRGGAWYNTPQYLRSANRGRGNSDLRNDGLGFRVSRTLTP